MYLFKKIMLTLDKNKTISGTDTFKYNIRVS